MNKLKLIFTTTLIVLVFSACSSKSETAVLDSSKQDVSDLLNKLIEKEKEINRLTQELEEYKKQKK